MTEREAWLRCAEIWRTAKPAVDGGEYMVRVTPNGLPLFGICGVLNRILDPYGTLRATMRARMKNHAPPEDEDGFRWDFNKAAAEARVAFCERMAKLCEEEQS